MQKEWEKHGTCDFQRPEEYLAQTSKLFRKLDLPSRDKLLALEYTSWKSVKQEIISRNRNLGLKDKHVFVKFRKGRLHEVRICYDLRFNFRSCR